jgi:hypothetical protein
MSGFRGGFNRSVQQLLILLDEEVVHGDVTDMVHGEAEGRTVGTLEEPAGRCPMHGQRPNILRRHQNVFRRFGGHKFIPLDRPCRRKGWIRVRTAPAGDRRSMSVFD